MKKKILFNIAFILIAVFCIILSVHFIRGVISTSQTIDWLKEHEHSDEIAYYQKMIAKFSIYATMSLLVVCFMIFMLVYINKNDIKELTVPVVQNVKESRQKKAEEKKQQQIQALEEKLNQLKKDDK